MIKTLSIHGTNYIKEEKTKTMDNKLSMINLMFEGEVETKEQLSNLRAGLGHAENLAQLAKIFGVSEKVVSGAISKELSAITKQITSKSKSIIKKSDSATLKSFGTQIPDELKTISKELAIKRLYDATSKGTKPLTRSQVKSIVDATKAETKLVFKDAQTAVGKTSSKSGGKKSTSDGGKAATNTNKVKDAIDAGKQQVQNLQTLVKKYPILKAVKAVVSVPLFVLRWFGKFKLLKWLIILGVGGFIYFNYEEWLAGGGKPIDDDTDFEPEIDFLKCILIPLGDDDGVEIKKENDNPVVYVKTGTSYDDKGGLIFRVGGSVETGDGSKKGTWSCNKSGLNIQEQSTGKDMTSKQLSVVMDDLNDNLSGDLIDGDSTDMVDALNIVKGLQGKFYKSVSAIKTLKHNYPKVYKTSLIDDINNLSNLDFEGMEKKEELLSILGLSSGDSGGNSGGNNKGDSDVKFDGNKKTGISHITIKWNDDKGGVTPVPGGKVKYVQCNDLPFKYGCISDKIKTIQKCLPSELKVDGYYGPKTSNALWNLYQGKEKGDITKSVYDKIVAKCNKKDNKVKSTKPRKKLEPITKIEPKGIEPLKRYDTEMVISQIDPEKMAKQIQKTIDGRRIDQIIKNELEYSRGRYVLKIDDELTENQLKTINLYMATKGFKVLRKKRETLDGSKYVWKADSRDAKRIARRERSIKKDQNKIEDIKNKDNE